MNIKAEKSVKRFVAYLWDDLGLEEQQKQLETFSKKWKPKTSRPSFTEGSAPRYKPFEELDEFYDAMELEFGLNLDDGWFRLCALHQIDTFVFYSRERYQADYLSVFSKNFKATRGMREWPEGSKSPTNPWKHNCIYEVRPLRIEWVEAHQQYKAEFVFAPGVTQTFWFPAEFKDAGLGKGWVKPRYISRTTPWKA